MWLVWIECCDLSVVTLFHINLQSSHKLLFFLTATIITSFPSDVILYSLYFSHTSQKSAGKILSMFLTKKGLNPTHNFDPQTRTHFQSTILSLRWIIHTDTFLSRSLNISYSSLNSCWNAISGDFELENDLKQWVISLKFAVILLIWSHHVQLSICIK